jgi:hypothetical protein
LLAAAGLFFEKEGKERKVVGGSCKCTRSSVVYKETAEMAGCSMKLT